MPFSNQEKSDMLRIYFLCQRNCYRSTEMYFEQYPEKPQPHYTYFKRLEFNMKEYGSFIKPRKKYGNKFENGEIDTVLNQVSIFYKL